MPIFCSMWNPPNTEVLRVTKKNTTNKHRLIEGPNLQVSLTFFTFSAIRTFAFKVGIQNFLYRNMNLIARRRVSHLSFVDIIFCFILISRAFFLYLSLSLSFIWLWIPAHVNCALYATCSQWTLNDVPWKKLKCLHICIGARLFNIPDSLIRLTFLF